ncbi:MAG: hypothetical protein JWQ14_3535, partial [Adhaeribacter sp.]|nr:hypothetical protein [Adhaeribacter sp.]
MGKPSKKYLIATALISNIYAHSPFFVNMLHRFSSWFTPEGAKNTQIGY